MPYTAHIPQKPQVQTLHTYAKLQEQLKNGDCYQPPFLFFLKIMSLRVR